MKFMDVLKQRGILDKAIGDEQKDERPYFHNNHPWNWNNIEQGKGSGNSKGPFGQAVGSLKSGQGLFSQNNMGQFQGTAQRPFGMGNDPHFNMMNPYQGPMEGPGNPNKRQPFLKGIGGM